MMLEVLYTIENFLKNSSTVHLLGVLFLVLSFYVKWENVKNLINRILHDNSFSKLNKNELHKSTNSFKLSIKIPDFIIKSKSEDFLNYLIYLYNFIDLVNVRSKSVYIKLNEHDNYIKLYPQLFKFFDYYRDHNGIKFIFQFTAHPSEREFIDKIKQAKIDLGISDHCIKIVT